MKSLGGFRCDRRPLCGEPVILHLGVSSLPPHPAERSVGSESARPHGERALAAPSSGAWAEAKRGQAASVPTALGPGLLALAE